MADLIYLDHQSTTPTDPRVRDAMLPFLEVGAVGNPHSELNPTVWRRPERTDPGACEARAMIAILSEQT